MAKSTLDKKVMQFVNADKDGVSVDWKKLADFKDECGYLGDETFQNINRELADFLFNLGFLVHSQTKGSYVVIGIGIIGGSICPPYPGSHYSFRRKEDAEDYLKGASKGLVEYAAFPAEIIQVR